MTDDLHALADIAPVVLIGRGGSGTRLLSHLALGIGVFLGSNLNVSSDSIEWVDDIYALALQNLSEEIVAGSAADHEWRARLRSRAATVLHAAGRTPNIPWGWKLPETTLILPQILRSFPKARVVHFVRHPLTSAWRRSHLTSRVDSPLGVAVMTNAYRCYGLDPQRMAQDPVWFHNAITWRYQVEQAQAALSAHDPAKVLRMHYEDVCARPVNSQAELCRFLDLPESGLSRLPFIDPRRMGTERPDAETARRVWDLCGELAMSLGYDQDI